MLRGQNSPAMKGGADNNAAALKLFCPDEFDPRTHLDKHLELVGKDAPAGNPADEDAGRAVGVDREPLDPARAGSGVLGQVGVHCSTGAH